MRTGRPITKEATVLGQRISAARRDAGLTQQQLAGKLGTTQRVVTYWEREAVGLKAEQLTALTEALGITLDKLMGRPQPKARGTGPAGRARQIFDRITSLPRAQQHNVLDTIEALMAGQAMLKDKPPGESGLGRPAAKRKRPGDQRPGVTPKAPPARLP